ncbi:PLP-dependent aminotransferase family protein [Fibrobacter sp. UWH1]|uniref:MocR-like pyridoxine biosynthesis transcription factor PdxR n=1 Tax=Fibrobacter sp. UWH1 TaxID=1964354 RepID=UPI000B5237B0|nr:PLP-dependent aminotransferase family protein [Fibrobacter sp. UWH1]OWV06339.1 GntR family transcriptional regulator [Fibrobacter sp. UWH1]
MLSYNIENVGSDTLYHFLYKSIKNDVLNGKLEAEEKLPSKRSLAKQMGISLITVETAYNQLLAEGYIYTEPRKGYFVSKLKIAQTEIKHDFKESREARNTQKFDSLVQKSRSAKQSKKHFVDFSNNLGNPEMFPFSTWAKITRQVLCENQMELLERAPYGGVYPLRKAIADMLNGFRNMNVDPEQIIVGAGTDYLYGLIVQILGFNKKYGVEDPGYSKISKIYRKMNVTCNFIPLDDSGVIIDQLEETCTDVIHISPSHHYPTGIVMPVSRRYELLSWAAKSSNRYIVEDDYDSEFRMTGRPISTLQNIDVSDKVIYINTFSKTLTSSARISYMVLPKSLAQKYKEEFSFYTCTVSTLEQLVLAKYISDGSFEKHINRMRNAYRGRRDTLLQAIRKSKLTAISTIAEEDAGLHFILKINTALSDEEFCKQANEKGVRIGALSDYYTEATPSEHQFIINYSDLPENKIAKALNILYEVAIEKS